jgi:hypothetical protein
VELGKSVICLGESLTELQVFSCAVSPDGTKAALSKVLVGAASAALGLDGLAAAWRSRVTNKLSRAPLKVTIAALVVGLEYGGRASRRAYIKANQPSIARMDTPQQVTVYFLQSNICSRCFIFWNQLNDSDSVVANLKPRLLSLFFSPKVAIF